MRDGPGSFHDEERNIHVEDCAFSSTPTGDIQAVVWYVSEPAPRRVWWKPWTWFRRDRSRLIAYEDKP